MKKQNYPEVFVKLGDFDINKLRVIFPEKNSFQASSGMTISVTKSLILYENDEGELCIPYVQGPRQRVFFSGTKPLTLGPGDDESTIVGYQLTYGMTSFFNKDEPSENEKYFIGLIDSLVLKVKESIEQFTKEKDEKGQCPLPKITVNGVKSGDDDWFKPVYDYPTVKDLKGNKVPDKTKPQRMYVKLITHGRDATLKVHTKVFDGEELMNVADIVNGDGGGACEIDPVFKLESVYYGSHGDKSYSASLQIKLDQCNYYPVQTHSTPRFIPPVPLGADKVDSLFGKKGAGSSSPQSPRSPREKKSPRKKSPRGEEEPDEEEKLKERIKRDSSRSRRHHKSKRATTGDE
jgi:hypothetical protein